MFLHDNKDQVIVESILNMAHLLRLNIIAEGVETWNKQDMWKPSK